MESKIINKFIQRQKEFTNSVRNIVKDIDKKQQGKIYNKLDYFEKQVVENIRKAQAPRAEEPLFKTYALGADPIINSVINKIDERSKEGMKKYGVPMTRTDITTLEWLKHAQEEAMDMAVYLERLIQDYETKI